MASDAGPGNAPAMRLVQGSQAPIALKIQDSGGRPPPPDGKAIPPAAALPPPDGHQAVSAVASALSAAKTAAPVPVAEPAKPPASAHELEAQVALLNKYLNDSGRPNQFRVAASAAGRVIQEINPANGRVIGEISAAEFPALAKSLGVSGILLDRRA